MIAKIPEILLVVFIVLGIMSYDKDEATKNPITSYKDAEVCMSSKEYRLAYMINRYRRANRATAGRSPRGT